MCKTLITKYVILLFKVWKSVIGGQRCTDLETFDGEGEKCKLTLYQAIQMRGDDLFLEINFFEV